MALASVVLAYDCKAPAIAALDTATEIVIRTGAKLTVVCVLPTHGGSDIEIPPGVSLTEVIAATRARLEKVKDDLLRRGVSQVEIVFLEGDPVDRILDAADKQSAELIVVGSRGLSSTGRFFLGSVSDGVLHHARCSVLVARSATDNRPTPPSTPGVHR